MLISVSASDFVITGLPIITAFRCFADKGLIPATTVFLVLLALFAVTAAPAWAQRTYDRVPIVKEGTTTKISPHVYVIPDENARGVPNVRIIVGSRATLMVDPGQGLKSRQAVAREIAKVSKNTEVYLVNTHFHPEQPDPR